MSILNSQTPKQFQNNLVPLIKTRLNTTEVLKEWASFRGRRFQYSPQVDIAVGPFSLVPGESLSDEYDQLLENHEKFFREIYNFHIENCSNEIPIPDFYSLRKKNQNARCLLAIEIENSTGRKHIMGSIVNAASLGRVGIGIAYKESVKRTFIRIMNYLGFLKRVGKNTYDTTNFLVVTKEQIAEILE